MKPLIATYSDFSSTSVHKIQPKYEPLQTFKRKRRYQSDSRNNSHILFTKPANKFEVRPLFILDSKVGAKTALSKNQRLCTSKKPNIDNHSSVPSLEWNFKPESKERAQWLYSLVKPETEFNPKPCPKKIPVSLAAAQLKNTVFERNSLKSSPVKPEPLLEKENESQVDNKNLQLDEIIENDAQKNDENVEHSVHDEEILQNIEKPTENEEKKLFDPSKNPEKEKNAILKYFDNKSPHNQNFVTEYKDQYIHSNTAKALFELKKEYNI